MLKKHIDVDNAFPAPRITPDLVTELRKEDMKQAVVERFRERPAVAPKPATNGRRPYPY